MRLWPRLVAVLMLIGALTARRALSQAEPVPAKKPFSQFPLTLANRWQGKELGIDRGSLEVLRPSDYMMRLYVRTATAGSTTAPTAPVLLYATYYESQRTGSTYHSPKHCIPGSGWRFTQSERVSIPGYEGLAITINKVLIEKDLERQLVLYWYQDRGRVITSEYEAKAYLVWDAMTKNRTDGALIRVSIPVSSTAEDAFQQGLAFVQDFLPLFQEYLPSEDLVS